MSLEDGSDLMVGGIGLGLIVWLYPAWKIWREWRQWGTGLEAKDWGMLFLFGVSSALCFLSSGPTIITWLIFGDDPVAYIHPITGRFGMTRAETPGLWDWVVVAIPWAGYLWYLTPSSEELSEDSTEEMK